MTICMLLICVWTGTELLPIIFIIIWAEMLFTKSGDIGADLKMISSDEDYRRKKRKKVPNPDGDDYEVSGSVYESRIFPFPPLS